MQREVRFRRRSGLIVNVEILSRRTGNHRIDRLQRWCERSSRGAAQERRLAKQLARLEDQGELAVLEHRGHCRVDPIEVLVDHQNKVVRYGRHNEGDAGASFRHCHGYCACRHLPELIAEQLRDRIHTIGQLRLPARNRIGRAGKGHHAIWPPVALSIPVRQHGLALLRRAHEFI